MQVVSVLTVWTLSSANMDSRLRGNDSLGDSDSLGGSDSLSGSDSLGGNDPSSLKLRRGRQLGVGLIQGGEVNSYLLSFLSYFFS